MRKKKHFGILIDLTEFLLWIDFRYLQTAYISIRPIIKMHVWCKTDMNENFGGKHTDRIFRASRTEFKFSSSSSMRHFHFPLLFPLCTPNFIYLWSFTYRPVNLCAVHPFFNNWTSSVLSSLFHQHFHHC